MPLRSRILALILIVLPFFLNLGVSALWDASEAFYGETAREMLERSDFVNPTFNYEPRIQKPPLTYWCIAAGYRWFGVNEFATRLPSATAVCLLLGFLFWFLRSASSPPLPAGGPSTAEEYRLDRRGQNSTVAFLALSILATTPRFLIVARRLPIDCLLTVFLAMALLLLYQALHGIKEIGVETGSSAPPQKWLGPHWNWIASGVVTGLAFLTKGPVALALILIIGVTFACIERKRPRGWGPLSFLVAFLVTAVPYYWVLFDRGGAAVLYRFLIEDNIGRYTSLDFSPLRGGFYYFQVLLVDAFPWSWFLPAAIYFWKSWRPVSHPLLRFCWIWFAVTFALFSFSRNKQEYYILPAYVALAVLLAHFFPALQNRHAKSKSLRVTALFLGAGLTAVSAILLWLTRFLPSARVLGLISLLLVLGAAAVILLFWRGQPRRAAELLAMLLLLVFINVCVLLLPLLETVRPTRRLTAEIEQMLQPGDHAGYFRFTSPSMSFYLKRHIFELYRTDELQAQLDQPGRSFLLMQSEELAQLPHSLQQRLEIVAFAPRLPTRGKEILKLLSMPQLPRILLLRERVD